MKLEIKRRKCVIKKKTILFLKKVRPIFGDSVFINTEKKTDGHCEIDSVIEYYKI